MAVTKGILGDSYTVQDKAVAIPIERYDELIKKEAFYDELTSDKHLSIKLVCNESCGIYREEDN